MNHKCDNKAVHGLETYKVLAAVLALNTFTIKELADFSGVNEITVRTILGRRSDLVQPVGLAVTAAKRGGRTKTYTLRPDAAPLVERQLAALSNLAPPAVAVPSPEQTPPVSQAELEPPISMLAAEDTLRRKYVHAFSEEERKTLVHMAKIQLGVARSALQQYASQKANPVALARLEQNLNDLTAINSVYEAQIALEAARPWRDEETRMVREALENAVAAFAQTHANATGMTTAIPQGISTLPLATAKLSD